MLAVSVSETAVSATVLQAERDLETRPTRMSANEMVRLCSGPASRTSWQGAPTRPDILRVRFETHADRARRRTRSMTEAA